METCQNNHQDSLIHCPSGSVLGGRPLKILQPLFNEDVMFSLNPVCAECFCVTFDRVLCDAFGGQNFQVLPFLGKRGGLGRSEKPSIQGPSSTNRLFTSLGVLQDDTIREVYIFTLTTLQRTAQKDLCLSFVSNNMWVL